MSRLSILFAALLMISALSLVTARFQSRQLFVQLDQLEDKARDLDTDWRRLQLERAELARNARIDAVARDELKMVNATPDRTIYIQGVAPTASGQAAVEGRP
ncbi:cell division protein FtsL [Pollutimonas thiosulfatoxidans]|uniref:Cell division protein FtsL n=1 Tax=Pollutimonas thiosulfatoxidans TaxID=2028345 RepID=A0A410GCQ9_9BURK|nr:cell division protein FtsL [Pollutimonas thiosulfatoxidans]MBF6616974.1 cell division protein FtsL [Candidimonas sp.]NYT44365.1 cell division protein FtsL [Alcaligenaceae bacterium]QAA94087.1 cell division protein FtsL [Pollutimonas thiosulfatoxidans]